MKTFIALLLLCSSAFAGGPWFSVWHIDGHGHQWQNEQLDAGLPLEPTVRLPILKTANSATAVRALDTDAKLIARYDGGPIVLRMNNVAQEMHADAPALPIDDWQRSHRCVARTNGVLSYSTTLSPFGATEPLAELGRQWATSAFMVRLQEIVPHPSRVILRENNEGHRLKFESLYVRARVYIIDRGNRRFATENNPISSYESSVQGPEWVYRQETNANNGKIEIWAYRWKTREELEAIDVRTAEWVDTKRPDGLHPAYHAAEFAAIEATQYRALLDAFIAGLTPAWQAAWAGTVGYSGAGSNRQHDAASPPAYLGDARPTVLTDPYYANAINTHLRQLRSSPNKWAERSLHMLPPVITAGAQQGLHDVIDPESLAGIFTHWAWALHSTGRDVRLVYWDGYLTKPTRPMVTSSVLPVLQELGRHDLIEVTIGDYERALLERLGEIHRHPVLSRYWDHGTTRVIESASNDAKQHRVYATETTITGCERTLLCVYTPCTLSEIDAGGHQLPAQRFTYFLTNPLEQLPAPHAELNSITDDLRRAVDRLKTVIGE